MPILHLSFQLQHTCLVRTSGHRIHAVQLPPIPTALPPTNQAHWKVLLDEIANTRPTMSRRLAAMPNLNDFKGVQIESDKAFVTMGPSPNINNPQQPCRYSSIHTRALRVERDPKADTSACTSVQFLCIYPLIIKISKITPITHCQEAKGTSKSSELVPMRSLCPVGWRLNLCPRRSLP